MAKSKQSPTHSVLIEKFPVDVHEAAKDYARTEGMTFRELVVLALQERMARVSIED